MQVVELEQENLRLNGVDEGKACVLDWRDRDAAEKLGKFDLVLGADLLYASSVVKVLQLTSVAHPEKHNASAAASCFWACAGHALLVKRSVQCQGMWP